MLYLEEMLYLKNVISKRKGVVVYRQPLKVSIPYIQMIFSSNDIQTGLFLCAIELKSLLAQADLAVILLEVHNLGLDYLANAENV